MVYFSIPCLSVLFLTLDGNGKPYAPCRVRPKQFSATGVQWVISQAARKAGIQKHVTSHVLRHSYATHLLEMGMDIMTLKEVMGHEDIKTQEFIRRFAQHILPKGFTRIRHYGILSSALKKQLLDAADVPQPIELPETPVVLKGRCPICKKGRMVTLELFDNRGPPQQLISHRMLSF